MPSNKVLVSVLTVAAISAGSLWWFSTGNTKPSPSQEALLNQENSHAQKSGRESGSETGGAGSREGGRARGDRPIPVLTAEVSKSDLKILQSAVGTVVSPTTVTVRSRLNGQLTKIYFQEGQTVKAGELLAELDARTYQAALTQMEGQALRDQAMLRNSQLDLERYKTLLEQDSIASQQVDAQASLVQQYQGTIKADQGLVDNAKLQLSFTKITAPISGRIGLRQIDVGNNILTTDSLAVINAVDPIQVLFTLPEDRVSDLLLRLNESKKNGSHLSVEAWDRGNTTLLAKGSLKSVDNQIDATSGTIKLKAEFKNQDGLLYPNQFVNIKLLSSTIANALVVPVAAIQRGTKGEFVYLLDKAEQGAKVWVTPVTTGINDGSSVEIKSGLNHHQQVVVSGIDKLRDGAKVTLPKVSSKENQISEGEGRPGKRGDGSHRRKRNANADTQQSNADTSARAYRKDSSS